MPQIYAPYMPPTTVNNVLYVLYRWGTLKKYINMVLLLWGFTPLVAEQIAMTLEGASRGQLVS